MSAKGDKHRERIDLGIGAILSSIPAEKEIEISIDLDRGERSPSPQPAWTLGPSQAPQKSEFDLLADERRWGEIVRRTEPRLSDRNDVEARLWWIRGHLGAFSMPVSLLAAPLDSLCKEIKPTELSDSNLALLTEVGLLALSRLQDVGEASEVERLRAALESVGVSQPRGGTRSRKGTSSFRSLDPSFIESALNAPVEESDKRKGSLQDSKPRRFAWTSACVLLVVGLVAIDRLVPHIRSTKLEAASDSFMRAPHEVELSRPMPERKEPGGRLGELFYSLDKSQGMAAANNSKPVVPPPDTSSAQAVPGEPPKAPEQVASIAQSPPQEARARDQVNTDGPVEGREFRERLQRETVEPRRPGREELRGGPPEAVLPGASNRGFDGNKTYRVLARTSVLSAPSYGGRVIGQLDRGDRVLVEGKLGRWLRLRSKKGKGGYVLAADVEPVDDL